MGIVAAIGDALSAFVGGIGAAVDVGSVGADVAASWDAVDTLGNGAVLDAAGAASNLAGADAGLNAGLTAATDIFGGASGTAATSALTPEQIAAGAGGTASNAAASGAGALQAGIAPSAASSLTPEEMVAGNAASGINSTTSNLTALANETQGPVGYDSTGMGGGSTDAWDTTAPAAASGTTDASQKTGLLSRLGNFLGMGGAAPTEVNYTGAVSAGAAAASGAGGGGAGGGSTLGTYGPLALGALAMGAKLLGGTPQASALPNSSSVNNGPYWNAPLNTSVPGRTAVNPFASNSAVIQPPTQTPIATAAPMTTAPQPPQQSPYWTYGSPEMTYFQGNSLANMGWPGNPTSATTQAPVQTASAAPNSGLPTGMASGGALRRDKEFRTGSGNHRVSGPGTETSDSIPAMLSNHEYVLDAEDMRLIGGGDPKRGADRLDRDRRKLSRGRGVLAQFARERAA